MPSKALTGDPVQLSENQLNIKLLNDQAILTQQGSATAAGLDFYSSESIFLLPKTQHLLKMGVSMEIPPHHFGKLKIHCSLALRYKLDIATGVTNNDYRGEVNIILHNNGKQDFTVKQGD